MSRNLENKIHDLQVSFFRGFLWSFRDLNDNLFSNTQLALCTFWLFIFPICLWNIRDCPLFGLQLWLRWINALKEYKESCQAFFVTCTIRIMLIIRFVVRNFVLYHVATVLATLPFHCKKGHAASDTILLQTIFLLLPRLFSCWWHLKLSSPVEFSFLFLRNGMM